MMTLHLGVIDTPYASAEGQTTGEVADILEARYGVMRAYYDSNEQAVADGLADGFAGTLESLLMGAPVRPDTIFRAGEAKIDTGFKAWLASGQIESMGLEGVPTKAALERRSQRFKKRKAAKPRPSFVDTGLYEASFKSEVEMVDWADLAASASRAYQGGRG